MNVIQLLFIFIGYSLLVTLMQQSLYTDDATAFPTLDLPDIEFRELGSCSGIASCTKYIGDAIWNIGLAIIGFFKFLAAITIFVFALFGMLIRGAVTGVEGAPWWINVFINLIFLAYISMIIFKMVRKGDPSG